MSLQDTKTGNSGGDMTITAAQIRGARGLLNWNQGDLSDRTGISATSIGSIENGQTQPRESTLSTIQKTFEDAGIEFLPGSGVRVRDEMIGILEGEEALGSLLEDIYETVLVSKVDEVLIYGLEERADKGSDEFKRLESHLDRLTAAGVRERIILKRGDRNFLAPAEYYRWVSEEFFSPYPFIIYANKLAMVSWGPPMKVLVIDSPLYAQTFRKLFEFVWERSEMPTSS